MKNKVSFPKTPKCEVCLAEPATSFSMIGHPKKDGKWMFCGDCTAGRENYYIHFRNFFSSPAATVDWLAHMHEKEWMDWADFMDMMGRFRASTKSFNFTNNG